MKLIRKAGVTSEIWQVFIADSSSTTGQGLAGLTNATSGLVAYRHRDTDTTATAISLVSMTVGTFTSGGFKEIDATNMKGWYQFCPPDNSIAAGAKSCAFHLAGATNMAPLPIEVQLIAADLNDTVRLGLTALPNAVAEAAGGLYTRGTGAGQINQDANGRVDTNQKAIIGTTLTETVGGYLAAAFKKLFDVATPVFTSASLNQTANLGATMSELPAATVLPVNPTPFQAFMAFYQGIANKTTTDTSGGFQTIYDSTGAGCFKKGLTDAPTQYQEDKNVAA